MKYIRIYLAIFLFITSGFLSKAQSTFEEGIIIYKADSTFNKITNKFDCIGREIRLYKKNNLYRLESIVRSLNNGFEPEIEVQLINENGKYIFKDSVSSLGNFAFFVSTEEEKQLLAQRALGGYMTTYKVQKEGSTTILNMPVEKLNLINTNNNIVIKVLLAERIRSDFGSFFEDYRKLNGTPLLFSNNEGGYLIRYRATSIKTMHLPKELFYIKPNFDVLTLDQLRK